MYILPQNENFMSKFTRLVDHVAVDAQFGDVQLGAYPDLNLPSDAIGNNWKSFEERKHPKNIHERQ